MNQLNLRAFTGLFAVLFCLSLQAQTSYTTTANGNWGDQATWGGTYVSSFFPAPPAPTNWFTSGMGDTIVIDHEVTLDYNIFVRDSDIVVISTTGSIVSNGVNMNSIYLLSDGQIAYTISGIQAGMYVSGTIEAEYFRNSSVLSIESTGTINLDQLNISGNFDNYGDIYNQGAIRLGTSGGLFNHNAGDLWMTAGSLIHVQNEDFENRAVIRSLPPTSCILSDSDFNNYVGGAVIATGGYIGAAENIDNSSNPIANFGDAYWCAGISGINLPAAFEDCSVGCGSPLPIELASFSGVRKEREIELSWLVLSASDFSHFVIERFEDDVAGFMPLEEVAGVSNTTNAQSYQYSDYTNDAENINYYRLKSVDIDGSYTYSDIISVNGIDDEIFQVTPNPIVSGEFEVRSNHINKGTLVLTDALGMQLWQKALEFDMTGNTLTLGDITSGVYWLQLYDENGVLVENKKIILR